MKIRAGYEISYNCSQPTPMILTLSVYPSRTSDLLSWDRMRLDPAIPVNTYHDSFGNFCHVIRAPEGRLTASTDFLVQDNGEPDPDCSTGGATRSGKSAGGRSDLILLGSRYCETDRLSEIAWSLFGQIPKGWPLVQAICDFVHERITFGYQHASPTKQRGCLHRGTRRVSGFCRSRHHILPLYERPVRAIAQAIWVILGYLLIQRPWTSVLGLKLILEAAGTRSTPGTTSPASDGF